ncbi:hypothetical protein G3580_16545 [Nitrogeniibacter mangrovi]|uniref:Uncharacterized protein n=1 Tax=Nitrogeniibacter mangrovi TaxID=2016596 RepID=A0A6C1B5U2_9RHOO|nr:hypothetical protein G3580_16545 [Nitrogeniibacter mangrovi]
MSQESHSDPLEFVRNMWNGMGFSLPGMVTPTVDVDELDKRIADMKAVEGWLKMNLNMLQMTIQGLEMQRATLMTLRHMGDAARRQAETSTDPGDGETSNPFAGWPWMGQAETATPDGDAAEADTASDDGAEAAAHAANAFASAAAAATNAAANAAMWPWQLMGEPAADAAPAAKPRTAKKKPAAPRKKPAASPSSAPRKRTPTSTAKKSGTTGTPRTRRAPAKKA